MSFFIPPNKAQLEYIKKEDIYRSPAELEEDITQLIEWLSKQPHLPNVTGKSNFGKSDLRQGVQRSKDRRAIKAFYSVLKLPWPVNFQ